MNENENEANREDEDKEISEANEIYVEEDIVKKDENEIGNKENIKDEINDERDKNTEFEIKIKIKDQYMKEKVINKRYLSGKGRTKNSSRILLEDKEVIKPEEKIKVFDEKNKSILYQPQSNKYYLIIKKYNLSSYRINNLSFEEAINKDKRKYFEIYKDYIFDSQIVLNLIFIPNYLEFFSLKVIFFMFIIGTEGLFVALLYQDKYINNIYDNNGKYSFSYNLPNSIFSVLITYVLDIFLFKLIISRKKFQEIMEKKNINYKKEFDSIIKCLKIKIIIFFIIDFILTGFSWYYCCVFCALYSNTAKFWLVSLSISLCIHLILPLIFCFIPTSIRNNELKNKKKNIYNYNKYIKFII